MGHANDRPLDERASRPRWIDELIQSWREPKRKVVQHEAWDLMRHGTITADQQRNMFVGFWPLIEKFPQFLALSLLKTHYGRHPGINAARSWLAANLSVEHRHAVWFLDWAEAAGVSRDEMLDGWRPAAMTVIGDWCWRVCETGDLAGAMAATNYAIEGATGDWTRVLAASPEYPASLRTDDVEKGMRWLRAHADYDDKHPYQALDLIARIVGSDPSPDRVREIRQAALKSYELYRLALDVALEGAAAERG